jgi:hypothetical protein
VFEVLQRLFHVLFTVEKDVVGGHGFLGKELPVISCRLPANAIFESSLATGNWQHFMG